MDRIDRRQLLGLAALLPLAGLAGCATGLGGYGLEEGVRRLLTLSSQRAFGRLLQPGGFYDDELARLAVPDALGGRIGSGRAGAVLGAVMGSAPVRRELAIALNDVAGEAAARAAPVVTDAIRTMSFADAVHVLRGGPHAATDLLQDRIGDALVEALVPEIGTALRSDTADVLATALAAATGIDYRALYQGLASQAASGIFRAIGREEAIIRDDPAATRDPVLIALLGAGGRP
ncbi:hypothetical protein CLG96_09420 [Sphingomonas oleivorans]|uniref:DUF4197 domain-containing protein n=2 Tax=Sphingomonas oleivorans TaxID=1735121 RepID=A0A2T5FYY3_9SPHN|nr:hypothetical protein CLG96_09420 [Sphingomonas oleivorans]